MEVVSTSVHFLLCHLDILVDIFLLRYIHMYCTCTVYVYTVACSKYPCTYQRCFSGGGTE